MPDPRQAMAEVLAQYKPGQLGAQALNEPGAVREPTVMDRIKERAQDAAETLDGVEYIDNSGIAGVGAMVAQAYADKRREEGKGGLVEEWDKRRQQEGKAPILQGLRNRFR